jgi:hypothetical protein
VKRAWSTLRDVLSYAASRVANPRRKHPSLPIRTGEADFVRSPFTGLTRASWIAVAESLLDNALQYSDGMRAPLLLPHPAWSFSGIADRARDHRMARNVHPALKPFARTLYLAAPLLFNRPDLKMHGHSVAEYYREMLLRGVTEGDPAWFGRPGTKRPTKHTCEATSIVIALSLAPEALWAPLTAAERARVLAWLDLCRRAPVYGNNWRWFNIVLDAFLSRHGAGSQPDVVAGHLTALRQMYADAGWFRDGDVFDYYSAWAMQFYPQVWMELASEIDPAIRTEFEERQDRFLETYPHIFSRRGTMPQWGRSQFYRFGAGSPLALAFRRKNPAIDPGFARRICSGLLLQFVRRPDFLWHGTPALGFYGEQPELIDAYSDRGSVYWCAKLFVALTLKDDNPFWTATENEGFWTDAPGTVAFGTTGLRVEHDRLTGDSRLWAPQKAREGDSRYAGPWFGTADT